MTQDELKQLEQDLAAAFPDWFRIENEGFTTGAFKAKRGEWVILYPLPGNRTATLFDAFLGACLDAAKSRGWKTHLIQSFDEPCLVVIDQKLQTQVLTKSGSHEIESSPTIASAIHEIPALAAALAILEAHRSVTES